VSTLSGPLRVQGNGTWSKQTGLIFNGSAQADPPFQAQLRDLLLLLGRDQGNGVYSVTLKN
jgi:type II secretion system (T2SS) protein N